MVVHSPTLAAKVGRTQIRPAPEIMHNFEERSAAEYRIAILTGGGDKPYALGLAAALSARGLSFDFIGSDDVSSPEVMADPRIRFLNLRSQKSEDSFAQKVIRIFAFYGRTLGYAARSRAKLFHILWTNKFEWFDRTLLLLYYRLLGKRLVFTAHNVNAGQRDGNDSFLNRLTLRVQYHLVDHIFVHTERMKQELADEFGVVGSKISVIPFGLNASVPNTCLTSAQAKLQLGLSANEKALLFFGNIAEYKGLEFLTDAFIKLARESDDYRLIIAGRIKSGANYWNQIQRDLEAAGLGDRVLERIEYIPDEETEIYFKAADLFVLPYTHIFQSGVLFLGYNFGLPAIAADVGSLRDEIVEGETGFVFAARSSDDLARKIREYFESGLYRNLALKRDRIREYASERYSWNTVAETTTEVYAQLLRGQVKA